MITEIPAALAVVQTDDGLLLLLKRSAEDRSYPGKWCFPGGRIDAGENAAIAIVRELFEETGITQDSIELTEVVESPLPSRDRVYKIHIFNTTISRQDVVLSNEHEEYVYVTPSEAADYDLAGPITEGIIRSFLNG